MRNLARIGLVAAFAACAFVGGCNKSARVEDSASASATCAGKTEACNSGKVCETEACCNAKKDASAAQCPAAAKNQN